MQIILLSIFQVLSSLDFGMAFVIAPLTKISACSWRKYSGAASGVNNAVARIAGLLAVALLGLIVVSTLWKWNYHKESCHLQWILFCQTRNHDSTDKLGGILSQQVLIHKQIYCSKCNWRFFYSRICWAMGITHFCSDKRDYFFFLLFITKKLKQTWKCLLQSFLGLVLILGSVYVMFLYIISLDITANFLFFVGSLLLIAGGVFLLIRAGKSRYNYFEKNE